MTEALVAAGGALLGVVLGAALTYVFTIRAQVAKSLHDTRLAAYARFASATMEYRRSLMERWFVERGNAPSGTDGHRVHEARSEAWAALFEVQLLAATREVSRLAQEAVNRTSKIKDADDREVLKRRAEDSRSSVEVFIVAARQDVSSGGSVP